MSGGPEVDEKTLGKKLQLARRRAGLTQQELCAKAGLSYSTLAKIERGAIRSPSVFTVAAIANATNTPLEQLLGTKSADSPALPSSTKKISKSGIRFVFFDLNGVLVRFFHRAFTVVAEETGAPAEAIETLFWRHNDAVCRGQLSLQDFNGVVAKELGLESFDWQKFYMESVDPMPGINELVKWAAEHYEVGILTDSMPGFVEDLQRRGLIPEARYTAVVDSSKVGAIKPEPRIYEVAKQLAAVEPREILLIDDARANLTAADHAGWHVLWFDDYEPEQSADRVKQSLAF